MLTVAIGFENHKAEQPEDGRKEKGQLQCLDIFVNQFNKREGTEMPFYSFPSNARSRMEF